MKAVVKVFRLIQERCTETAVASTICGRQPTCGDLLGIVGKRISVATGPYGQVSCGATQIACGKLKNGYRGRIVKINLLAHIIILKPLCVRFAAWDISLLDFPKFLALTPCSYSQEA